MLQTYIKLQFNTNLILTINYNLHINQTTLSNEKKCLENETMAINKLTKVAL